MPRSKSWTAGWAGIRRHAAGRGLSALHQRSPSRSAAIHYPAFTIRSINQGASMKRLFSAKSFLAAAVALGAVGVASAAHAGTDVTFSIGVNAPYGYVQ